MHPSTVLAILFTAATFANQIDSAVQTYVPASDLRELAKSMPESSLPRPDGLALKYVLLGIGTQNYTCTDENEDAVPSTIGAVAKLYDIGTQLKDEPLAERLIPYISQLALFFSLRAYQLDSVLHVSEAQHLIGHHFFDLNTPVFALDGLGQVPYPIARVQKVNETDAPALFVGGASIKWLLLKDTKGVSGGGIDTVYRVETAGGNKPATCKGQKSVITVEYAAQYWIFGPA